MGIANGKCLRYISIRSDKNKNEIKKVQIEGKSRQNSGAPENKN
jgi:hypothetical protein